MFKYVIVHVLSQDKVPRYCVGINISFQLLYNRGNYHLLRIEKAICIHTSTFPMITEKHVKITNAFIGQGRFLVSLFYSFMMDIIKAKYKPVFSLGH